jgi:hypothetical protein
MSNITHYALWYYSKTGEKSANAISLNPDSLLELHHRSVADPECYYHQYKKSIRKISVEPIECFSYSKDTGKMERVFSRFFIDHASNATVYATYKMVTFEDGSKDLQEIIVALTPEEYKVWCLAHQKRSGSGSGSEENIFYREKEPSILREYPRCFYEETISNASVQMDNYYAEGIMNA